MLELFLKGLAIGFAIAAPVGPIGILCIQQSLHHGFKIGVMTGMGAALADGTYGLIAGFGLTTLFSLLTHYHFWIHLLGGLFLIYLGITIFFKAVKERTVDNANCSSWRALGRTFLLTLTNPTTILSFAAVFAGLGLGSVHPDYQDAMMLVIGITLGSSLWWLFLSAGVAFVLHHRLSPSAMQSLNRFSGIIIFLFGVIALTTK